MTGYAVLKEQPTADTSDLATCLVFADGICESSSIAGDVRRWVKEFGALWVATVDAEPAFNQPSLCMWMLCRLYLLGENGILALLFDPELPGNIERNVLFVLVKNEHLLTAFRWEEALALGSALEEAADVAYTDPMVLTGSAQKYFTVALGAAADDTALVGHLGDRSLTSPKAQVSIEVQVVAVGNAGRELRS